MATTASGDVKIYQPQFQGAFIETLQQNIAAFNELSGGALVMRERRLKGQYEYEAFFDEVSAITRRDPSTGSSSTLTPVKLTQDDLISVKLHRVNGPYEWNVSAAFLAGFDPARFSLAVGEQAAIAVPREQLNNVLAALEAKLDAVTALEHDATDGTIQTADLADGLNKFGDAAGRIVLWIMHSKVYNDLLKDQLAATATVLGTDPFGNTIFQGVPATLGRRVLVTDSTSLLSETDVSTGDPRYSTLGLVAGAAKLELTELPFAVAEGPRTGSQNLYITFQAEYGYNMGLKGCQWDVANGGSNPTDTNVATATNWDSVVADNKLLPGVIIRSK